MYAEQRYTPRTPRTVSLGAAVAINGLLIAGLISMVPNIVRKPPTIFEGRNIPIETPPPVDPVEPKVQPKAQNPLPYIPPNPLPVPSDTRIESTDVLPTEPPLPTQPVADPGPAVVEPPAPLPPLIGAEQDPRFARDFQPEYPSQELRAQRDGRVSLRVLIGTDGRVKAIEQLSATSPAFFEATRRQALAKWRFRPATRGGVPQESWKVMNVRFELKNL